MPQKVRIDITGNRYGRLTVLGYAYTKEKKAYWTCQCDCGSVVIKQSALIRYGHTRSCGCLHKDQLSEMSRRYNIIAPRRLYQVWHGMLDRCENEKARYFYNYGGRGISICDEWHDYEKFASWALSNGYSDELTIERIDNNGNYSPNNCKWATKKEQENNKRTNHFVTMDGETKTISQWCELYGTKPVTVQSRLRLGWSEEKAIKTQPISKFHPQKKKELLEVKY